MLHRLLRPVAHGARSVLGTNGLSLRLTALESKTRELLAALEEQWVSGCTARSEAPFSGLLSAVSRVVELPADLRLLHIPGPGSSNPGFDLVVRADPGPYDQVIISDRPYSDIAVLLNLELGGVGTLIDLGANIGTIAMAVAAAGSSVIAVEMLPGNCLRLMLAALANGFSRIRVVQAAVNSSDGMLPFSGDEAWGTVVKDATQQAVALRLDTILTDAARENPTLLRPPFALKIDIEGHEYQALLGADRFLADHRPIVIFESIQRDDGIETTRDCKDLLIAGGYHLFMLRERLLIPKAASDIQEELVGDFVAVPSERVGTIRERLVGFEIRQPTMEERLRWLVTLSKETNEHRQHAIRVIDTLGQDDAAFAAASADLRLEIIAVLGQENAARGPS